MCTAATYKTKDFYFGRTLDYEFSYGDEVAVTPRNYPFAFRHMEPIGKHYAMIGMAYMAGDMPLYYDAVNEKGLGIAGLNFVGNACYTEPCEKTEAEKNGRFQVAQFEFIPWLLGTCTCVKEVREKLAHTDIVNTPFSKELPLAKLHWLIADREEAITVESVKEGLQVYDNPVGVMTNNPPFPQQMFQLNNYRNLSTKTPANSFSEKLPMQVYSRGMGALGLPGDLSSQSRFVRVAFTKMNAVSEDSDMASISQFFHILGSVEQQKGCCDVGEGKYEITIYTSCCNTATGVYYYTTYDNHQITGVDMHREDLEGSRPVHYPLIKEEQIRLQNA